MSPTKRFATTTQFSYGAKRVEEIPFAQYHDTDPGTPPLGYMVWAVAEDGTLTMLRGSWDSSG